MIKDLAENVAKDILGREGSNSSDFGGPPELGSPDRILLVVECPKQGQFP